MELGQIETVIIYNDKDYNDTFWKKYYNYFSDPSDTNFSLIEEALLEFTRKTKENHRFRPQYS